MRQITHILLPLAFLVGASGCVYFNTYYNAQKYFRQAEKARKLETEAQLERGEYEEEDSGIILSTRTEDLYEQAAQKALIVMEDHPESDWVDDAAFLTARALYWRGNYSHAIKNLINLEENFPQSPFLKKARYWRALAYEQQNDSTAEELYRSLFAGGDDDLGPEAGFRLGEMAFAAEEYAGAAQEYRRTIEAYPESDLEAELYLRLGEALVATGDTSRFSPAVEAFTQVGRSSAENRIEYAARLNVGKVQYARGDIDGALSTFQRLLRQSKYRPFEGRTRLAIGQLYRDRGQIEEALKEFGQVRDDFPGSESSAMALYRTGLLYLQEYGNTERAEEYFKETKAEKPRSEGARLGQLILRDLGELERLRRRIFRADSLAVARGKAVHKITQTGLTESTPGHSAVAVDATIDDTTGAMATGRAPALAGSAGAVAAAPESTVIDSTAKADSSAAAHTADVVADSIGGTGPEQEHAADPGEAVIPIETANDVVDSLAQVMADSVHSPPTAAQSVPDWFFSKAGKSGVVALSETDDKIVDDLFEMADIFRSKIEHPDSASHYFTEIVLRYPDSEHVLRALYAIAWVHLEMRTDEEAARPFLDKILDDYPASEHANAARRYLGREIRVTSEEAALVEFMQIEDILVESAEPAVYIPLIDSLSAKYSDTRVAAQAAFRAAWQYENVVGDSAEAARRYEQLTTDFPTSDYAELIENRREAEKSGLIDKLERELKTVGGVFAPGEYVDLIAVEPDSADSVILSQKHFRFGLRAYNRERLEEAREQFELSLDQKRRNPDALHLLGDVLWKQGYNRDGIDRYQEVLHFSGNHLGVRYSLFKAYVEEGVADSANYYLQAIVGQDSRNSQIQFLLEEHPEIGPPDREELDMYTLERIELADREDNLALREKELRLAERPLVRRAHVPEFPLEATADSAEVVVDILVGRGGRPKNVEIFTGEEPFRTAALEAAEKYQFYPATRSRRDKELRPLEIWVELVLNFVRPTQEAIADRSRKPEVAPPQSASTATTTAAVESTDAIESTDAETATESAEVSDFPAGEEVQSE